ncbi:MAG: RNA polymerase sigma factor RpoD/SigA [Lentisphaeraceae bacterium]|nr:RNA polymerase sigma factor RpoD/SigA [Lentisphaeraceae bacterium]
MRWEPFSGLHLYMEDINEVPLLSRKEESELGHKARNGDSSAIERLITSNLRLVVKIAHDFKGFGVPLGDLIAEGNLGLIKAATKFNPEKGAKFSSYSAIWIKQSIRLALAKLSRTVRIPISSLSKVSKIQNAVTKLENSLKREPSDKEVAEFLDFPLLTIKHLRHVKVHNVSLQQKLSTEDDSGELQDQISDDTSVLAADKMEAVESLSTLKKYFDYLKDREKLILTMRFGLDGQSTRTLEEVSQAINLTRERVRQIQIAAMEKLRKLIRKEELGY